MNAHTAIQRSLGCFITGATGVLGSALCRAFASAGYAIAAHGRRREAVEKLAAEIAESGAHVIPVVGDLASPAGCQNVWEQVKSLPVDILINNAAIQGPIGPFIKTDMNKFIKTFDTDFLAPARLCWFALPDMLARGFGRIINLSGGGGTGPRPNFIAYACAKTALIRFTEILALECAEHGVTVNAIAPGVMDSFMTAQIIASGVMAGEYELECARKISSTHAGPQEAVHLCLFLASPAAGGITGKIISAKWDEYGQWTQHVSELENSDLYTLRRITCRDRGLSWGDK